MNEIVNTNFQLFAIFWTFTTNYVSGNIVRSPCLPSDKKCEFDLWLDKRVTMTFINPSNQMLPVYNVEDGSYMLRSRSCTDERVLTFEEAATVITGDGGYKEVIAVNGQMPGPQVTVFHKQQVVVRVHNKLLNEAVTLHWHGLHMQGTPWMDGVASVSHCPIQPGQSFTYRFIAAQEGTHWYHGHFGSQRSMGLYGPFIVLPQPLHETQEPEFDGDMYLVLSDFMHESSESINYRLEHNVLECLNLDADDEYVFTKQSDGLDIGVTPFDSAVINGKGRYYPYRNSTAYYPFAPLEQFNVSRGGRYRIRIISAAMLYGFALKIHSHALNVIATDGGSIEPIQADTLVIQPGERYDIWISADDPDDTGNYWIEAENGESIQNLQNLPAGFTKAVLHYNDAEDVEPTADSRSCTLANDTCLILNCPTLYNVNWNQTFTCIHLTDLNKSIHSEKSLDNRNVRPRAENEEEFFLNFHFQRSDKMDMFKPVINGIAHKPHVAPIQMYHENAGAINCNSTCDPSSLEPCFCTHILPIPLHTQVYMIWYLHMPNLTLKGITGTSHPIHMHGHSFEVLKIGQPVYNETTGYFKKNNEDISCLDELCNNFTWRDPSWSKNNIPGAKYENAVRKDTVWVPGGGYALVRFVANNPGYWYMHCHMEMHNELGMALILQVGDVTDMPKPPGGLSQCGDFDISEKEFEALLANPGQTEPPKNDSLIAEPCEDTNEEAVFILSIITAALLTTSGFLFLILNRKI